MRWRTACGDWNRSGKSPSNCSIARSSAVTCLIADSQSRSPRSGTRNGRQRSTTCSRPMPGGGRPRRDRSCVCPSARSGRSPKRARRWNGWSANRWIGARSINTSSPIWSIRRWPRPCWPRALPRRLNSPGRAAWRRTSRARSHRSTCVSGRMHRAARLRNRGMRKRRETEPMSNVAKMRVIVGDKEERVTDQVRAEELRILEALLFAAEAPLDEKILSRRLPAGADVRALLTELQKEYAPRGVNLVRIGGKWTLRTANDLAWLLTHESVVTRKLSRAAIETLAIVAYHQPVTRAEVEDIRGVSTSKGTLDVLLETGWIRLRGRRKAPGRPVTYGTNEAFLSHFGLDALTDLPGLDELKGSGLIDGALPADFAVPIPSDDPALRDDEEPLGPEDLDLGLAPPAGRTEE